MDEVLTMDQINERFDSEWVVIDNPETEPGPRVLGGKVVFHSKDREEIHRYLMKNHLASCAVFYIGVDHGVYVL